jgi:hypothetical protein
MRIACSTDLSPAAADRIAARVDDPYLFSDGLSPNLFLR